MQDTKNLKRKVKEYKKEIKRLEILERKTDNGFNNLDWYRDELKWVEERIKERDKNRLKNKKQFKKAN